MSTRYLVVTALGLISLVAFVGCADHKVGPTTIPLNATTSSEVVPTPKGYVNTLKGLDGSDVQMDLAHLSVYQITVPFGIVSRNESFWKRVDENAVDPATYALLRDNGIRVGIAAASDWPAMKPFFDAAGAACQQSEFGGFQAKDAEFEMSGELAEQTLFWFDGHGPAGQVFDACKNFLSLTFMPAPRKPGTVRVTLCPMVRATRRRLEYTRLNEGILIDYVAPEKLLDLRLCADVPAGHMLVVAPSPESTSAMTVGQHFFTTDGGADRHEIVFLFAANSDSFATPGTATRPVGGKPSKSSGLAKQPQ